MLTAMVGATAEQRHRYRRQLAALLMLALHGCAGGEGNGGGGSGTPLLVMAAASLNAVMPELIERFEARGEHEVDLVLGSTGNLAAQIANGAPGDVFFSADEATIERLRRSGSIRTSSERTYATGRLALVWRRGVERPGAVEALREPAYRTIGIANPEHAPYGVAARQALEAAGLWPEVEPRIVQGENVAQAYQFVQTGNADAAVVALSVVNDGGLEHIAIEPSLHAPIRQAAGVLEGSRHPAAGAFIDFVMSDEGQSILSDHGFGRGDE